MMLLENMYEPFDLQRALKGEACITREGLKVFVEYCSYSEIKYPLFAVFSDTKETRTYTIDGLWSTSRKSKFDIVGMYPKEKPTYEYWNAIRNDLKYLAKDMDGEWFFYVDKPILSQFVWKCSSNVRAMRVNSCNIVIPPSIEVDWKESLIKRPTNKGD